MSTTTEIRPGTVGDRDLAVLGRVLSGARLVDGDGVTIDLPDELAEVLVMIVEQLRAGNGVSVAPLHAELTTVEAAELLNVSRPHLIKQLESGAIPYRMVGTHRRVRLADVLDYRDRHDAQTSDALELLTRQAEEHGLYDD
jgi:excisionase family DNA binding protein